VEASLFEALLEDPGRLVPRARLEPEAREGEIVGYRLGGVIPGGLLDRLGLVEEDRIELINGERLRGPEALGPIRASARRTAQVTVILDRNGFHKLMIYRLVYH
jgi:type II secretory pathway component PulC